MAAAGRKFSRESLALFPVDNPRSCNKNREIGFVSRTLFNTKKNMMRNNKE